MAHVKLEQIIEKMKLENLTPELDISKIKITQPDINRPALQMAGYFEHFEATILQIIGFVEYTYMEGLPEARKKEIYQRLLSCEIPAIVLCRELQPGEIFLKTALFPPPTITNILSCNTLATSIIKPKFLEGFKLLTAKI